MQKDDHKRGLGSYQRHGSKTNTNGSVTSGGQTPASATRRAGGSRQHGGAREPAAETGPGNPRCPRSADQRGGHSGRRPGADQEGQEVATSSRPRFIFERTAGPRRALDLDLRLTELENRSSIESYHNKGREQMIRRSRAAGRATSTKPRRRRISGISVPSMPSGRSRPPADDLRRRGSGSRFGQRENGFGMRFAEKSVAISCPLCRRGSGI